MDETGRQLVYSSKDVTVSFFNLVGDIFLWGLTIPVVFYLSRVEKISVFYFNWQDSLLKHLLCETDETVIHNRIVLQKKLQVASNVMYPSCVLQAFSAPKPTLEKFFSV